MSGHALNHLDNEQSRIEQEKAQKVDEEVEKAVTEAEALQALSADLERQKAIASGGGQGEERRLRGSAF